MTSWSSHLIKTSVILAAVVTLAISVTGGTYALWHAQVSLPGAVITAGHASLNIDGPYGLGSEQLYPGQTASAPFAVTNTGTVPLALRVDSLTGPDEQAPLDQQDFTRSLTVHIWAHTGEGCTTAPSELGWSGAVGSFSEKLVIVVDKGMTQPMCLAATLDTQAPATVQGVSLDLQLTVGGVQQ